MILTSRAFFATTRVRISSLKPLARAISSQQHLHPVSSAFQTRRTMADITPIFAKDAAPPAGPYSHAIKTPHAIYLSGQIHLDVSGNMIDGSITEKTAAVFRNIEAVVKAAGTSLNRIVKCNIFLSDMAHFAEMNAEYEKWMAHRPARSCVAVKQLPKGAEVEIECIALP